MDAPEKIYIHPDIGGREFIRPWLKVRANEESIEYTRTDAFIEKALKWYCLDCECNDNCKNIRCFFYREFERYLKGKENALPPKFTCGILNEDGSTSDNWRYRHFIIKMRDAFIEKAEEYLKERLLNYIEYCKRGVGVSTEEFIDDFIKAMKGE